ncbi:MAG TPA: PAS domain-containing protein [Noviherbaspirillum sp.]|uniref:PAS domain-containing sensor histidine kinase n=1 Tax=Noviherbaspirillum sp. TaxID=1926288 RepID=UPI002B498FEC|nr:PAS domain-containing protein [Noviherbaspirillum sp.]HJV88236.1 PAS domain-containing protein [Noviherbaspirillum sp.]
MKQTWQPCHSVPQRTSDPAYAVIALTLILAAFVAYLMWERQPGARQPSLDIQFAAAAGILSGIAACLIARIALRRWISAKAGVHIPQHIKTRWYERAQVIARFGTYEIHVMQGTTHEVHQWSQEMFRIVGRDPVCGPLSTEDYIDCHVHPEDRASVRALMRKALQDSESTVAEYRVLASDDSVRYLYDYLEFVTTTDRKKIFIGQVFDITERKLIEHERMEAAARYQAFVEQLGGVQYICNLDDGMTTIYIGNRIRDLLGFTPEEWCADTVIRFRQMHEGDRAHVQQKLAARLSDRNPLSIEYRIFGKDGTLHWLHDEAQVINDVDGKPMYLQGVMFDITDRKQAQQELERSHDELKKMISTLDDLMEEEQRRLAREMHDDLGQLLAAMKMDLSDLQQYLPQTNAKVLRRVEGINDLVNTMVASVRRIIADLPPRILEDLGVVDAVRLLASNFQKRYGIRCDLHLPGDEIIIGQRVATAMYRMVQEALNNVVKHSNATQVAVCIEAEDGWILLEVADNGKGMEPGAERKAGSFGLIGIRERTASLDGTLDILSEPGISMTVRITIPLHVHHLAEHE